MDVFSETVSEIRQGSGPVSFDCKYLALAPTQVMMTNVCIAHRLNLNPPVSKIRYRKSERGFCRMALLLSKN